MIGKMKSSIAASMSPTPMDLLAREMREQADALRKEIFARDMEIERLHGKVDLLRQDARTYRSRIAIALTLLKECSASTRTAGLCIEHLEGTPR